MEVRGSDEPFFYPLKIQHAQTSLSPHEQRRCHSLAGESESEFFAFQVQFLSPCRLVWQQCQDHGPLIAAKQDNSRKMLDSRAIFACLSGVQLLAFTPSIRSFHYPDCSA